MASLLMHIVIADEVKKKIEISSQLYNYIEKYRWAYNLGALLPDLPLFEDFRSKVLLYLFNKPYPESNWANVTHTKSPQLLVQSLLKFKLKDEVKAILLGYMTHLYLDAYVHEYINDILDRYIKPSQNRFMLHELIENYQSLLWHRINKKCNDLGRKELVDFMKFYPEKGPKLPPEIITIITISFGEAFGEVPKPNLLKEWCKGVYEYTVLISSFLGKVSNIKTEMKAKALPWVDQTINLKIYKIVEEKLYNIFKRIEEEKLIDNHTQLDKAINLFNELIPFKNMLATKSNS